MASKYAVKERLPGRAYTTFRCPVSGEERRADITDAYHGPFNSVSEAADWLSQKAVLHASYEIITMTLLPGKE